MQRLAVIAGAWLGLAGAVQPGSRAVPAREQQSWTVALPAGRVLSARVAVGSIRLQGEARADALIEVIRSAPSKDGLSRIPVAVDERDAEVRLTALQPENGTEPAYRAEVTLRVPREATLGPMSLMEGALTLTSFAGHVDARVRRGTIEATNVQGSVRLETEIGNITASAMRLMPDGLLRLRTFNGDVRLALAERPRDARILALALNGTINSELPLTIKDSWGPRWGEATLGSGEPVISIDVVNGHIWITSPR